MIQAIFFYWFGLWLPLKMVNVCAFYLNVWNTHVDCHQYFWFAVMAVPLSSFYPYGTLYDSNLGPTDDDSGVLDLAQPFVYFGVSYSLIYVSDCTWEQLLYTGKYVKVTTYFYEQVYTRTNYQDRSHCSCNRIIIKDLNNNYASDWTAFF